MSKHHVVARPFKYSVIKLIELVKLYPILWDSSHAGFRSYSAKEKAWKEIYVKLDDKYRSSNERTQAEIASRITAKWRNIRDAFIRSFKKRALDSRVKRYMFHDRLEFMLQPLNADGLLQTSQRRQSNHSDSTTEHFTESFVSFEAPTESLPAVFIKVEPPEEQVDYKVELADKCLVEPFSSSKRRSNVLDNSCDVQRRSNIQRIEMEQQPFHGESYCAGELEQHYSYIQQEAESPQTSSESLVNTGREVLQDEDESFFASTMSLVKDMTPDEKLDFRMTVLQTIHQIRYRRRISSQTRKS